MGLADKGQGTDNQCGDRQRSEQDGRVSGWRIGEDPVPDFHRSHVKRYTTFKQQIYNS